MAVQIGQRIADLSRDNQSLRDMSEKTLQDEAREWRARQEKLAERLRRPEELKREKTAEKEADEQYYDTQPIGEHPRVKAEEYFDKKTGDPIDDSMLTREMRARNKAGQLTRLADTDSRKQLTTLKMLEPVLKQYTDLVQYAYGTRDDGTPGPLAQYARTPSATASAMMQQALQRDPVLQAKRRALEGQLQSVVRALGARGDLNQQELEAATGMLANMDASMGLGLSLSSGPMFGTGGLGVGVGGSVKPSISIPDTPATGLKLANELVDLVNARIGSLLRNKDYKGTPAITLPGTPGAGAAPSVPVTTKLRDMTADQIRQAPGCCAGTAQEYPGSGEAGVLSSTSRGHQDASPGPDRSRPGPSHEPDHAPQSAVGTDPSAADDASGDSSSATRSDCRCEPRVRYSRPRH